MLTYSCNRDGLVANNPIGVFTRHAEDVIGLHHRNTETHAGPRSCGVLADTARLRIGIALIDIEIRDSHRHR